MAQRSSRVVSTEVCVQRLFDAFLADVRSLVAEWVLAEVARAFDGSSAAAAITNPAVVSEHGLDPVVVDAVLARVILERSLSTREAALFTAAAHGVPRSRIAEVLGTSENTIKTQTRQLLRKLGHRTLDEAVWQLRTTVGVRTRGRRTPGH